MEDFETHPRGTGEVLRQLRAEREALTVQVDEQRRMLELRIQQLELQRDHWQTQFLELKAKETP